MIRYNLKIKYSNVDEFEVVFDRSKDVISRIENDYADRLDDVNLRRANRAIHNSKLGQHHVFVVGTTIYTLSVST